MIIAASDYTATDLR
jgi:hypothetical protein